MEICTISQSVKLNLQMDRPGKSELTGVSTLTLTITLKCEETKVTILTKVIDVVSSPIRNGHLDDQSFWATANFCVGVPAASNPMILAGPSVRPVLLDGQCVHMMMTRLSPGRVVVAVCCLQALLLSCSKMRKNGLPG